METPSNENYDYDLFLKDDELWNRELDCFCSELRQYAQANKLGLRSMRAIFNCGLFSARLARGVRGCMDELGDAKLE